MKKKRIAKETSLARGSGQRPRLPLFSDTPKAWRLLVKIELSQDFAYGELPFLTAKKVTENAGACCIFIIFSKARIPKLCKLAIAQTVQSS